MKFCFIHIAIDALGLAKYIPLFENQVVKSVFFYDLIMQTSNLKSFQSQNQLNFAKYFLKSWSI